LRFSLVVFSTAIVILWSGLVALGSRLVTIETTKDAWNVEQSILVQMDADMTGGTHDHTHTSTKRSK
jgi:hypothetical protein